MSGYTDDAIVHDLHPHNGHETLNTERGIGERRPKRDEAR
jgi:hypothetical protein